MDIFTIFAIAGTVMGLATIIGMLAIRRTFQAPLFVMTCALCLNFLLGFGEKAGKLQYIPIVHLVVALVMIASAILALIQVWKRLPQAN